MKSQSQSTSLERRNHIFTLSDNMERSLLPLNLTKGENLVILTISKDSGLIKHPGNPYFSQLRVEYEPSSRYYSTYRNISFHAGFQNLRDPWHLCGNQRRFSRISRSIQKTVGKSWARVF